MIKVLSDSTSSYFEAQFEVYIFQNKKKYPKIKSEQPSTINFSAATTRQL